MWAQILNVVGGVVFIIVMGILLQGAALMVCDRERAWRDRRDELVSGGDKADGDDTGRESKEEDS
jgi:ABC-type long-subunit fatty acid transport system fused permease/ATPase subunit